MALLNSSNVDFSVVTADVTIVFLSIFAFTVLVFSFRKILSMLNAPVDDPVDSNMGYSFKQWSSDMDYIYKKR